MYQELVDAALDGTGASFYCFVADRDAADPIDRFGTPWDAYAKLAEQLVVASVKPGELLSIMADNYSAPDDVLFEQELRASVNRRLGRLAAVSVCRLDSKASDGLQIADLLVSAVTHEFRADAGMASKSNHKAKLSHYVRGQLGAASCLAGWRNARHSVQVYNHGAYKVQPPNS